MLPRCPPLLLLPLLLFILRFIPSISASCPTLLPTSTRILSGLASGSAEHANIVTLAFTVDGRPDYHCAGSLIAPNWVLTAAQCFALPSDHFIFHGGSTSLSGFRYSIAEIHPHPAWATSGPPSYRGDLKLIRLSRPVLQPDSLTPFNPMRINNNTRFPPATPRYLRVKGFGITNPPTNNVQPLSFSHRELHFADLQTAPCGDDLASDHGHRICTKRNTQCGPCFGDTGSPLYDVDRSGEVAVLVGLVTFGRNAPDPQDPACTGLRPVIYTAVAPYAKWISSVVGRQNVSWLSIPDRGITNINLAARNQSSLAIVARTSAIIISSLALLATVIVLLVSCTLRAVRRRKRRWADGLNAEDSFVKGRFKDASLNDPFEGIQNDHRPSAISLSNISRAVRGATEFSARSIGALKALLIVEDNLEDIEYLPRLPIDNVPDWVPAAWDSLFQPPSREDLLRIHKVPTQRVVDDVLEGGDKSVEPSLKEVAFKSARDEANLETAWAKLEVQTSLRNLSDASQSNTNLSSAAISPPLSPRLLSPRFGSRNNSSYAITPPSSRRGLSALLSVNKSEGCANASKQPEFTRADTLLAAFASIDAESEQVAEETMVDSMALDSLAMSKRPSVFDTIRKKFLPRDGRSRSGTHRDGDIEGEGGPSSSVRTQANNGNGVSGVSSIGMNGVRFSSRGGSSRGTGTVGGVLGSQGRLLSRHSSMGMDYFSEDYSLSDSSSDGEGRREEEDFASRNRRYTDDRRGDMGEESRIRLALRGFRKGPVRSFESLEKQSSKGSISDEESNIDEKVERRDEGDGYDRNGGEAGAKVLQGVERLAVKMEVDMGLKAEGWMEGSASSSMYEEAEGTAVGLDENSVDMLKHKWNELTEQDIVEDGSAQ